MRASSSRPQTRGLAHVVEVLALVDGERVGPGEVNEENIVLAEIVLEAVERQAAVAQFLDEGMGDVGLPVVLAGGF
jgi:hypothetical protein